MALQRPRFHVSIHTVIVALVLALVAPAAGFLGVIVKDLNSERAAEIQRTGEQRAAGIADRLEEEFQTQATILAVFASSGWLEESQYELLHQRARTALFGTDRYLIVLDADLNQILNTRVDYGPPLGRTSDAETARTVLETGRIAVSNLFEGQVANALVFNVLRRAVLSDGRRRVLILTRNAADLGSLFPADGEGDGWSFAIFDGRGRIAFSAFDPDHADGKIAPACAAGAPAQAGAGDGRQGRPVFNREVNFSDWRVCVWPVADRLSESAERSSTLFFLMIVLWFIVAVLAAIALSIMLSRSIANAAQVADALDAGENVPLATSFVSEIDDVLKSLAAAARERLRKDEALRMLVRETAHRAKNQIAIATSLLGLSARRATNVTDLKNDLTKRLLALGRSIDMMAGGSVETAPLSELINVQLSPFLNGQSGLLELHGQPTIITQSAAQSFGLVLHELATNASKYGGWSRPGGRVRIAWCVTEGDLVLDWTETGPPAAAPQDSGFGTTLIDFLVEKGFAGTICREYRISGFFCRITVPVRMISTQHTAEDASP